MDVVNVVLVGRNSLFRQGLRRLLDPAKFSIVGEARDLSALKALLEEGLAPDRVAELNGCQDIDLDSLREIRAAHEGIQNRHSCNRVLHVGHGSAAQVRGRRVPRQRIVGRSFSLSLLLVMMGEKALPSPLASMLANDCYSSNGVRVRAQKDLYSARAADSAVSAQCL